MGQIDKTVEARNEAVNHPSHYTWLKEQVGIEPIDICQLFNFNLGNVLKYVMRAGRKDDAIQDLEKAAVYLKKEIERLKKLAGEQE